MTNTQPAKRILTHALAAVCLTMGGSWAWAQNAIKSVSASAQGEVETVRIEFLQDLNALPSAFATQKPARVALDFPGLTGGVGRSIVDINQANVQSANVVQTDERSRVVLTLKRQAAYSMQLVEKALLITFEPVSTIAVSDVTQTRVTSLTNAKESLSAVDFHRGADGAGRVRFGLSSSKVVADVRQLGSNLVVDFADLNLPDQLRRKLDVVDFGTPVQTITTTEVGDRVRIVIAPQGEWEHTAYQTENELVIDIKPLKSDPKKLTPGTGYTGQKLSLNFQSIDVRQVLQVIADFTGFNVVTSDSVSGTVTLRLLDVPWD